MYHRRLIAQKNGKNDGYDYVETDPTGRYGRFDEVLGKGAMKTVYKGIDEVLGMEVAWYQVRLNDSLQSPEDLQRLYSEVHLLSTLDHESIMRFYTSWIDIHQRTFNFITEMFSSGTLREYRKKYRRVDIRAIKIWARQILDGLIYLHGHDPPIIHRDLKCDNIFVNGHLGQVKIGDLGLAAILCGSHRAHSVIGTPEFMAPEMYEENYDELVDVYSFGMCVLEMLTSEYPYSECTNPAQIYKKVTSGKRPKSFFRVQNTEAQCFIGKCLETASKRLSAMELMLDPFLLIDNDESANYLHQRRPFLNNDLGIEKLLQGEGSPRTNMTITGKLNPEDNTIFLKVQIVDEEGTIRNVFFPFDIVSDTPFDVATEMVRELELTNWEPSEIADMIDGEISALLPQWKKWNHFQCSISHTLEDDDDSRYPFCSFSSSSPSQASLSGLIISQRTDKTLHGFDWIPDDLFDDTSSQSSFLSENYSKLNYYGDEHEPDASPNRRNQHAALSTHSSTRFSSEEHSSLAKPARNCYEDKDFSDLQLKCIMDNRKLTRHRSLVDMRCQLLHRSLVEEINKRRLFNTVGAFDSIGFQEPSVLYRKVPQPVTGACSSRTRTDAKVHYTERSKFHSQNC